MNKTQHMVERMHSRNISQRVVDFVLSEGEWNGRGDRLMVGRRDLDGLIPQVRNLLKELERLRRRGGATVVLEGNTGITTYCNDRKLHS